MNFDTMLPFALILVVIMVMFAGRKSERKRQRRRREEQNKMVREKQLRRNMFEAGVKPKDRVRRPGSVVINPPVYDRRDRQEIVEDHEPDKAGD